MVLVMSSISHRYWKRNPRRIKIRGGGHEKRTGRRNIVGPRMTLILFLFQEQVIYINFSETGFTRVYGINTKTDREKEEMLRRMSGKI